MYRQNAKPASQPSIKARMLQSLRVFLCLRVLKKWLCCAESCKTPGMSRHLPNSCNNTPPPMHRICVRCYADKARRIGSCFSVSGGVVAGFCCGKYRCGNGQNSSDWSSDRHVINMTTCQVFEAKRAARRLLNTLKHRHAFYMGGVGEHVDYACGTDAVASLVYE